ncbi:hypothetical protein CEUSTIGMA_g6551.t1 [Chlamydomonas eustigma]|uniref:Uncharacterized protein n=1 Tax=Chlamydomonas eustigma TaxID=1157962 RepID=A0A250X7P3_9CHLO|nr:hypothetical protein CEUSTIGMA_g6551.t1 [Chlamydomonas eustigma]|eukprot:GAX79111.1 hypothetical protein CEUSTIGMA_g6551.t1 [Chlamydomonas eustigma]
MAVSLGSHRLSGVPVTKIYNANNRPILAPRLCRVNGPCRMFVLASPSGRDQIKTRATAEVSLYASASSALDQAVSAVSKMTKWAEMSYSNLYDNLFSQPLDTKKPVPKPAKDLQGAESGSNKILLSDVHAVGKRPLFNRKWTTTDVAYAAFIGVMHLLAWVIIQGLEKLGLIDNVKLPTEKQKDKLWFPTATA